MPRLSLFKHQLIDSMWMKEHEIWDCEGDWNAEIRKRPRNHGSYLANSIEIEGRQDTLQRERYRLQKVPRATQGQKHSVSEGSDVVGDADTDGATSLAGYSGLHRIIVALERAQQSIRGDQARII